MKEKEQFLYLSLMQSVEPGLLVLQIFDEVTELELESTLRFY